MLIDKQCAIVGMCGVGDIPNLMFPAIHSQLFPTDHFYVVEMEDIQKQRLLARSLGQDSDIIPVIHALHYLQQQGYEKIILVGESAGGATAIRLVSILQNRLDPLWDKITLKDVHTDQILQKLQRGGIWLRAPLLSVSATAKHLSNKIFAPLMKYFLAPLLTQLRFNPFKKEPVDAVLDWQENTNISVLFTPSKTDEVLGQEKNDLFFERLKARNGENFSFRHDYIGTHIQSFADQEYPKKVYNFLTKQKPD